MYYERPYYEDLNYHPFLFYVIFGVKDEELKVSRERHHVDEFPEGLDFLFLKKPENEEYMESFLGGTLGEILGENDPLLYKAAQETDHWAIIRGEVCKDSDLNYMRNAIGFVQALVEDGAVGVLDLLTFTLFSAEEWEKIIFEAEFTPYSHTVILESEEEEGSIWLHTRGMRKFGRPDISMEKVPKRDVLNASQVVDQMIFYGALGVFFSKQVKLHTRSGMSCIVTPKFIEDMDNPDFNNSYYKILWSECQLEAKKDEEG